MAASLKDEYLYTALKAQIHYHKYLYYVLDNPEITDYEYDMLEKRFDQLAEKIGRDGSWVGYSEKKATGLSPHS